MTETLKYGCICNWDDCRAMREEFLRRTDDPRGQPSYRLSLDGEDEKSRVWRDAVLSNLNVDASTINLKCAPVARHHWSIQQLEYFDGQGDGEKKKRPNTPVSGAVIRAIADPFDPEDKVLRGGKYLYFNTPNYPRDKLRKEAFRSEERNDRSSARDEARAAREVEQQRKRKEREQNELAEEFSNLDVNAYGEMKALTNDLRQQISDGENESAKRIRELESRLKETEKELKKTKSSLYDKKRRGSPTPEGMSGVDSEPYPKRIRLSDASEAVKLAYDVMVRSGGEGRLQFSSKEWHELNPNAAKDYLGFESYQEFVLYVSSHFTDVEVKTGKLKFDAESEEIVIDPPYPTEFEQILIVKYFMQSTPVRKRTGNVFGIARTTVLKYITIWAPRWAKFGEQLSILPIPRDYFMKEMPEEMRELGLVDNEFMTDGKDGLSETLRKDDPLRRRQNSSKMKASAFRFMNFTSNAGLSFEHTRAYGARVEETALIGLHGSYEKEKAPMEDWKDYANSEAGRERTILTYWTLLDDIVSPEEALALIENDALVDSSNGGVDAEGEVDVAPTAECSRNESEQVDDEAAANNPEPLLPPQDSEEDETEMEEEADKMLDDLNEWYKDRVVKTEVKAKMDEKGVTTKKLTTIREDEAGLKRVNMEALAKSPQGSPEEFLQQLEVHERLHRLYESRELTKCLLSAYLHMTKEFRWECLSYMGSEMTPANYERVCEDPPDVFLRLHKITPKGEGLADKAFEKCERLFPYFNRIRCPRKLRFRKVKQYHTLELIDKRSICTGRYIVEVPFSRLLAVAGLRDVVPYENIRIVPYMLEWGHAQMNLAMPLRKPGRDCGLPVDYWAKKKALRDVKPGEEDDESQA